MKGIKISYSYDDACIISYILEKVIENKANKSDLEILEAVKEEMEYRLKEANKEQK